MHLEKGTDNDQVWINRKVICSSKSTFSSGCRAGCLKLASQLN